MAETRGTFILSEVLLEIKDNNWVPPEEVFFYDSLPNTGYFGGGNSPKTSLIDKVDYSSDTTAVVPGLTFSSDRQALAATGNSTAGYFGGGLPAPLDNKVEKVSYYDDTRTLVPGAQLTDGRGYLAATGNSVIGYFGGGKSPTGNVKDVVDKLTYSTNTTLRVPGAALSAARYGLAATGNSVAGYFGGGGTPSNNTLSTMDKVTYSSDTTVAVPGASLSAARYNLAATGNSTSGYFGGGLVLPSDNYSTMDKVTYSTDTTAAVPGAALSATRYSLAATGNSTSGYFGGGKSKNPNLFYSTMDKIDYSTDTRLAAIPGLNLSVSRLELSASSLRANGLPSIPVPNLTKGRNFISQENSFNSGYFGGGTSPDSTIMDKLTYSTDTTLRVPVANLTAARWGLGATGNSTSGYFGGGINPGLPNPYSTMDKVTYSSDTTAAVPGASLSAARYSPAATGNSTAGYFGGGTNAAPNPDLLFSTMDKVTYSTDTTAAVPGAALSAARRAPTATGNQTAGYFGGGTDIAPNPDLNYSTIEKVTYSTDTTAAVPSAGLSAARYNLAATGDSTTGYFGGGDINSNRVSTMDKLSYSTDTAAYVANINLSVEREKLAATGNLSSGYFSGGENTSDIMDKVTYSTDTISTTPAAILSTPRRGMAASSSTANALPQQFITPTPQGFLENTGYFGGGRIPGSPVPDFSTMDKLSYSTDTTAAVPTAALRDQLYFLAATGNSTTAYFAGGNNGGSPGRQNKVDKITYATDTVEGAGTLSASRDRLAATGNSTAGYFGGGGGGQKIVDKLSYSSDTTAAVPSANLTANREGHAATGNQTAGYFGGGQPGPVSTVDKLTYGTDTTAAVPGATLSVARYNLAATGNSTHGYFGGGNDGGSGLYSTIDKLNYYTDTAEQIPSGLSIARGSLAATGNQTTGYFGGGGNPDSYSTMDKLSYSTDTAAAAATGASLSVARYGLAAASCRANAVRSINGTKPQVPVV